MMVKRLTKRSEYGRIIVDGMTEENSGEKLTNCVYRLAAFEDIFPDPYELQRAVWAAQEAGYKLPDIE